MRFTEPAELGDKADMKRRIAGEADESQTEVAAQFVATVQDRYFTSQEVASRWRRHPSTIRRMFIDTPGVLKFCNQTRRGKRHYTELRIPESLIRQLEERGRV